MSKTEKKLIAWMLFHWFLGIVVLVNMSIASTCYYIDPEGYDMGNLITIYLCTIFVVYLAVSKTNQYHKYCRQQPTRGCVGSTG